MTLRTSYKNLPTGIPHFGFAMAGRNAFRMQIINENFLSTADKLLKALDNPIRQAIIERLESEEEVNVMNIYQHLSLEQSLTSIHLRQLRQVGLVSTRKAGKFVYYRINRELMDKVNRILAA
jgi:ArsR family transcriptional regulator